MMAASFLLAAVVILPIRAGRTPSTSVADRAPGPATSAGTPPPPEASVSSD